MASPPKRPLRRPPPGPPKGRPQPPRGGRLARLTGWWRQRTRPARILIAGSAVLAAALVLYFAVRSVFYLIASGTPAASRLPDSAHIYVRIPNLAGFLDRAEDQKAWQALTQRVVMSPSLRTRINEQLAAAGAPALEEIGRRRAMIERFAGRDFAAAFVRGNTGWKFIAATRLSWGQYLLAPFARIFVRVPGLRFRGAHAIFSNDPALLDRAAGWTPAEPESEEPMIEVRFPEGSAGDQMRAWLSDFPVGTVTYMVDWRRARGLTARVRLDGASLLIEARVPGGRVRTPAAHIVDLSEAAPATAVWVMPAQCSAQTLWDWVLRFRSMGSEMGGSMLLQTLQSVLSGVDAAQECGFEQEVLPLLDGPTMVLLGVVPGRYGERTGRFPTVAVVFGSSRPAAAFDALERVWNRMMDWRAPGVGQAMREFGEMFDPGLPGTRIREFVPSRKADEIPIKPAFAEIPEGIVFGFDPEFVRAVHGGIMGRTSFFASTVWLAHSPALARWGLADVVSPQCPGGLVAQPYLLVEGSDLICHIVALSRVDSAEGRARLRAELLQEAQQMGIDPNAYANDRERFERARAQRIAGIERRLQDELEPLRAIGLFVMRLRREGDDLAARAAITFR